MKYYSYYSVKNYYVCTRPNRDLPVRDSSGWPRPGQPNQDWGKVSRDLRDLAKTTRLTAYLAETLEDLVETTEIIEIWSRSDTYQVNLADGRSLLPLTLKPRSVKLIHHKELGNTTLSGIHSDKRAQQGRPIRII